MEYVDGLNAVDWDEEAQQGLQFAVKNSTQAIFCGGEWQDVSHQEVEKLLFKNNPLIGTKYLYNREVSKDRLPLYTSRAMSILISGH